jgi:hypothetical protein
MLVLAIVLTVAVERCGEQLPWAVPLWLQALACAALGPLWTGGGVILNIWLGWACGTIPICRQFHGADLPAVFRGLVCHVPGVYPGI